MASDWATRESATEGDAELRELEDELCRLAGVVAVRVVGDHINRPVEIHVLSDQSKPPKQTVRDVRALAQTVFGLELDHRIVSVAQLDDAARDGDSSVALPAGAEHRRRVAGVSVEVDGVRAHARVVLEDGENEAAGYADGSSASVARAQLVASATLDALRQLEPQADGLHIDAAQIARLSTAKVAVVTVVFVEPPAEVFVSGSAVVRLDRDEAVARALLDATNRKLGQVDQPRARR